jgi:ribosomal-protein-alanine N-acetyltransferase
VLIETPRLLLRHWTLDDVPALYAIQGDLRTMSFWPKAFTLTDSRAWIERALVRYAERGFGRYAVLSKANGHVIGDCGVVATEMDGQPVNDIGWIIARPLWGQGLAVEAAAAVRDYAFANLGLASLHANMPWNHHASRIVAERIGMRHIRTFENQKNRNIATLLYELRADGA